MKKSLLLLMIFAPACGTYVGNGINPMDARLEPRVGSGITSEDFVEVENEYRVYRAPDCGSYTGNNTDLEIKNGRDCIVHAHKMCSSSRYFYNRTNPDGSRFVSFVSVYETSPGAGVCEVYVHTVSNEPGNEIIDAATCFKFKEDQIPELACGIGR